MNLHSLKPAEGAVKTRKRIGRGQGSGKGGTSTRGHKGQMSRSGSKHKIGFEGGQMPLQRRVQRRKPFDTSGSCRCRKDNRWRSYRRNSYPEWSCRQE